MKIGVKAYARFRRERVMTGGTAAAVRKAIERGQIQRDKRGLIDVVAADRAWPSRVDLEGEPAGGNGEPAGGNGEPAANDGGSYADARRRKETALAELREFELAERQGQLVSIDFMEGQLSACLLQTRQVLNTLPGKIAPLLIGCSSVGRAQLILQEAIDEAMPTLQAIGEDPSLDDE